MGILLNTERTVKYQRSRTARRLKKLLLNPAIQTQKESRWYRRSTVRHRWDR